MRLQAWQVQIPALYVAYMEYKYGPGPPELPNNLTFFHIAVLGIEGVYPPMSGAQLTLIMQRL